MALDVNRPKGYRRAWNGGRDQVKQPLTAAEWNQQFKPGMAVIVVLDDGTIKETKTRSEAWETDSGHPLVKLEGISGGYSLSRVAPK